jgi:hypothetical protein
MVVTIAEFVVFALPLIWSVFSSLFTGIFAAFSVLQSTGGAEGLAWVIGEIPALLFCCLYLGLLAISFVFTLKEKSAFEKHDYAKVVYYHRFSPKLFIATNALTVLIILFFLFALFLVFYGIYDFFSSLAG